MTRTNRWRGTRRRGAWTVLVSVATAALLVATGGAAQAVNTDHGQRVVGDVPVAWTPHVVDGSVQSFVQLGNKMIAAGTFTRVRQNADGPDIVRNGIFAFDAGTGQIDMSFDPNLGGAANSLDTDGTFIYVGGSFGSVGGVTSTRRVAKLRADGTLVPGLRMPNSGVNEVVVRGSRLFIGGQFSAVGGVTRNAFAVLDTRTGQLLPEVDVPFTGTYNGGGTAITRMDVDPAGERVVAVGNFISVAGQPREQIAMIETPEGAAASLSSWSTERYSKARNPNCSRSFATWMRDVDFSADGRYFVVTTTGAFGGGANNGAMCDTVARWENGPFSGGREPTWVNYSGGDTLYGVAVTGSAVYVGGHQRWMNNSFQGDNAGPGAVPREGIAALDPVNGLPLSWNPGRTRGVGAQALYATGQGLWVGSDTDRFNQRLRMRVAFVPLAGGKTLQRPTNATLPNDVFAATRSAGANGGLLYRVNANGPVVQSHDSAADWTGDAGRVTGGGTATYTAIPAPADGSVGDTPGMVFSTERTGNSRWTFPVAGTTGRALKVRLFFASNTNNATVIQPGQRRFNVTIDGATVLQNFDIVAETGGHRRSTVREFTVTSDGSVNVDLTATLGTAVINGIEIIDTTVATPSVPTGPLVRRAVSVAGASSGPASTASTAMNFSRVRGMTVAGGELLYGLPDGGLYTRSFNPDTGAVGAEQPLDLYDDPEDGRRIPFQIGQLTGLAFDATTHRLYYTLYNDNRLFYRHYTPESRVVGSQTFTSPTTIAFGGAAGLAVAGTQLLWGSSSDGNLRAATIGDGGPTGAATVVDTSGTWRYRGFFVSPSTPNEAPTASFAASCDVDRRCTFDASASSDPDGTLTDYSWTFGAGGPSASGRQVVHTFGADGTYAVTLRVTDNRGATAQTTAQVQAVLVPNQPPIAAFTVSCQHLTCTMDGSQSSDPDGSISSYAWDMGDGTTATGATASRTYTSGGTRTITLAVTDSRGATASASRTVQVVPPPPPVSQVAFRDATSVEGNVVSARVTVPPSVREGDVLVLSLSQNTNRSIAEPTGIGPWTNLGTQVGDRDEIRTTTWYRVAGPADAGATTTVTLSDRAKVVLSLVAYSGVDRNSPVVSYAAASETSNTAAHTTPGAADVPAGAWIVSGWADKTSATTDWVEPAGETQRVETIGIGAGRVTALITDRGPVAAGSQPGRTATADSPGLKAISWTLVLRP